MAEFKVPPCPENWEYCDWCGAAANEPCLDPDYAARTGAGSASSVPESEFQPSLFPELEDVPMQIPTIDARASSQTFEALEEGEARHFDDGKPDLTLLDRGFLESVSAALGYGAAKYGVDNWRKGSSYRRYTASALRHIEAFLDREDLDHESGEHHLAHAVCNLMFVMAWQRAGKGKDDRFQPL